MSLVLLKGSDLVEEQNFGNVIINHIRTGRYEAGDIDGVPHAAYNSD
jgi:hypothetical protein